MTLNISEILKLYSCVLGTQKQVPCSAWCANTFNNFFKFPPGLENRKVFEIKPV